MGEPSQWSEWQAVLVAGSERFFSQCCIGNVQAWAAQPACVSVAVSFYADVKHADSQCAYTSSTINLSAVDARALAATLIAAADYAEAVAVTPALVAA